MAIWRRLRPEPERAGDAGRTIELETETEKNGAEQALARRGEVA
jgi:hypothetical protein